MGDKLRELEDNVHRRSLGFHLTSRSIFLEYILPEIKDKLWKYTWIDLFAGEGNLILPILDSINPNERIDFFKNHIYLFDIQVGMIQKSIEIAETYGIPSKIASNNIKLRDNLESFPISLKKSEYPLYHITNPPYLYLGYIRKHSNTHQYLKLFEGINQGYQDLYQIAMINDLRSDLENLIYIIPSNFLYGASVSNKFRLDFLMNYNINRMMIFETKMFEYTGTNICIGFFKKKKENKFEDQEFLGLKFKKSDISIEKVYNLKPEFKYRAGHEFDEFSRDYRANNPLKVKYYLLKEEVQRSNGSNEIKVIDANDYKKNTYTKIILHLNDNLKEKIESNILYVRTVDTGSYNGRVGLGIIAKDFNVKGIYVSGNTYRTHPIQIFIEPRITQEDQILLKSYFNFILETFRESLDSEFLTTYKYSKALYTRKYLGLIQVRLLIESLPILDMNKSNKTELNELINKNLYNKILDFLNKMRI